MADTLLNAALACDRIPVGFVDDNEAWRGKAPLGIPVLGTLRDLSAIDHDAVVVAIGDNARRHQVAHRLQQLGETLISAIHPSALIGRDVQIGTGTMLSAGAIVNTGTSVGKAVIVNTGATVDHHSVIEDCVHIAPGVHMGGEVRVGTCTLIGIGAAVLPRVRIGRNAIVGAGAVVTRNVPDEACVVGNPARQVVKTR